MSKRVSIAFDPKGIVLPIEKIVPLREGPVGAAKGSIGRRIAASLKSVGVVEPFIVFRKPGRGSGEYLLLEGNYRLGLLKAAGQKEVYCLLATDDEGYTYNRMVNHLPPIQEHFMILNAIESGVPEERIAETLAVDVASIREKRDLLRGICKEAVTLLEDKRISAGALRELKKVIPMCQIELVQMMIAVHNFSAGYAKCLLASTKPEKFIESDKSTAIVGMTPDQIARIERELDDVSQDFKRREEGYGRNMVDLTVAVGYVRRILDSAAVVRFLSQCQPDVLREFQRICDASSFQEG